MIDEVPQTSNEAACSADRLARERSDLGMYRVCRHSKGFDVLHKQAGRHCPTGILAKHAENPVVILAEQAGGHSSLIVLAEQAAVQRTEKLGFIQ